MLHVTANERPALDGHDIVIVAPAAEIQQDSELRAVFGECADSMNDHGFYQQASNLRNMLANIGHWAAPIQKHESGMGSEE